MLSEFATGAYTTLTFGCCFSNCFAASRMNDHPVSVTTLIVTGPPAPPGVASAAAAATAATPRTRKIAGRRRRARPISSARAAAVRAGCGGAPDTRTSLRPKPGRNGNGARLVSLEHAFQISIVCLRRTRRPPSFTPGQGASRAFAADELPAPEPVSAQVLVRLHVEPHREERELRPRDQEQGDEHDRRR